MHKLREKRQSKCHAVCYETLKDAVVHGNEIKTLGALMNFWGRASQQLFQGYQFLMCQVCPQTQLGTVKINIVKKNWMKLFYAGLFACLFGGIAFYFLSNSASDFSLSAIQFIDKAGKPWYNEAFRSVNMDVFLSFNYLTHRSNNTPIYTLPPVL